VKKVVTLLTLVGALVTASAVFAGNGGGLSAHLARLDARVAKYQAKCQVANPKPNCAIRKANLTARLTKFEAKLDARIAKHHNAARVAVLQAARDHVAALLASL
jgi:hypothetical protein